MPLKRHTKEHAIRGVLRNYKKDNNLTNQALADLFKVNKRTIQRWLAKGVSGEFRQDAVFAKLKEPSNGRN